MHNFTTDDLLLMAYKETTKNKTAAINLALEEDWDLREQYNEILANIQSLEKITLSPRKKTIDKILMYAENAVKHLSTTV